MKPTEGQRGFFTRFRDQMTTFFPDWGRWWAAQSLARQILPALVLFSYWALLISIGGFRGDHFQMGIITLILFYGGPLIEQIRKFIWPVLLTAIIYDSMRFWSDYVRGAVRVIEPYRFDHTFFGITTELNGHIVRLTPNEFLSQHLHPVLDFFTGISYFVFVPVFVLLGGILYFRVAPRRRDLLIRAPGIMWSFFWVNMVGYSTYYWYPAAPPWYVAQYGLGPARMDVGPSGAFCGRFDQLLGTHFFDSWYGRSADVFGAVPSLHVAYPLITVYYAFQFGSVRLASMAFHLLICFAALYLYHHYVLDILWGTAYALITVELVERHFERKLV